MHKWKCMAVHIPRGSYLLVSSYWRNIDEAFVGVLLSLHAVSISRAAFSTFFHLQFDPF